MSDYLQEPGTYNCVVLPAPTSYIVGIGAHETPAIALPFFVEDGEQEGKEVTGLFFLTEKAMPYSVRDLAKNFGWDGDLEALMDGSFSFEGSKCSVTTVIEVYEGNSRCKVSYIGDPPSGFKALPETGLRSLIAKMGAQAKATARGVAKAKQQDANATLATDSTAFDPEDLDKDNGFPL